MGASHGRGVGLLVGALLVHAFFCCRYFCFLFLSPLLLESSPSLPLRDSPCGPWCWSLFFSFAERLSTRRTRTNRAKRRGQPPPWRHLWTPPFKTPCRACRLTIIARLFCVIAPASAQRLLPVSSRRWHSMHGRPHMRHIF
ncbi:hypothetical protein TW95_gp0093 [Pandoravirus inopinatum]|uniref:Uncharacterized protein n=1 Tax=Pandoravirus inopinatum TaxID=1605721 RepID=A0A0B5JB96_9VIRU|nr:hypothetical protein TW95_gp0093 [Pandoravirus inopinatum]AJF96827.1 hypothetical protein [Pandoravirus inopinatum]